MRIWTCAEPSVTASLIFLSYFHTQVWTICDKDMLCVCVCWIFTWGKDCVNLTFLIKTICLLLFNIADCLRKWSIILPSRRPLLHPRPALHLASHKPSAPHCQTKTFPALLLSVWSQGRCGGCLVFFNKRPQDYWVAPLFIWKINYAVSRSQGLLNKDSLI